MVISQEYQIKNVIKEFNKFHGSEIKAKIITLFNKILKIEFSGSFCHTCGLADYFEDFQILLNEKLKIKSSILSINNNSRNHFFVEYEIK